MRASRGGTAALALVLATGLAACDRTAGAPPQAGFTTAAETAGPGYIIGPGDELTIFVFRAPELGASLPVRPDGRLSIPLVPDIEAAGRTPSQLAAAIEERLREYVRDPNVTVMVRSFVGPSERQIRVIGEAAQPMSMPWREGMTLLDVMIGVRGLTRYAAGNRAEVVRRRPEGGPPEVIRVRLSDLVRDGDISQDIAMRPGDTLIIPQGWF
jgi:polysaccharide export outer membrane protein